LKSRAVVWGGRALGMGLIALVLYLVGWNDRVVDPDGNEHWGRVVSLAADSVRMETDDGEITVAIAGPGSVKRGLGGAFSNLSDHPMLAGAGLLLNLLALVVVALRWGILLDGADLALPTRSTLRISWIGHFLSTVVPGGLASGDVLKSLYVAHEHHTSRTRALVTAFSDRIIALFALCAVAGVTVLLGPEGLLVQTARVVVIVLLCGGVFAGAVLYSAVIRRVLRLHHLAERLPFPGIVGELKEALSLYRTRPGHVAATLLVSFIGHGVILSCFYAYGTALGADMNLAALLVAIPVAQIVSAVPGLPGGWGVGDFAFFFFLPAAGIPAGHAVALSFVYRASQTVLGLPGGLMLTRRI
jgi:uncharacterized protein (TIRG00374 family)